jgi:hypothetical protein
MKKPRMAHAQVARLGRLLWMLYKPSEIADEIGLRTDRIYKSYIPTGCPNRRDEQGNIWIVGSEFAEWARKQFARPHVKTNMGRDQAWCLRCRKPVDVVDLVISPLTVRAEVISGTCPLCGVKVRRARVK